MKERNWWIKNGISFDTMDEYIMRKFNEFSMKANILKKNTFLYDGMAVGKNNRMQLFKQLHTIISIKIHQHWIKVELGPI